MEQIGNKRCHYVQQARLKQFARTEGNNYKLTVVDLDRKKIGTRNVDRAFYSKGLYTDRVEEKLNRCVEAPGMQVFGKIYESSGSVSLTRNELEMMKKYILVQFYRNPANISDYSPDSEKDIFGINKKFKNDAEAAFHVNDAIDTIFGILGPSCYIEGAL